MELSMISLDGKEGGKIKLSDEIFGLEVRQDLLEQQEAIDAWADRLTLGFRTVHPGI